MEALFRAACLREPSQRAAFLKSACGGDERLRNEVAWLLTSDEQVRTDSGELSTASGAQVAQSTGFDETVPASNKRAPFRCGDSLGRYIVLEQLGSGGMGVVYAAYDPELDRKVAIKLLQPEASEAKAEQGPARMLREAQALARLSHPNIIPVFDVGTWGEQVFIAMEYLDGRTLKDWLGDSLRPWREVLSVFLPAGRGLAAAHAAGLVHRDFKPSNVFIGKDGRVRVLDFGLARAADAKGTESTAVDVFADTKMTPRAAALAATLTGSGLFMGTPAYMAPEQLLQLTTDGRTDQFSFCAALYEGLYGERPFAADKLETLVFEVTRGKVREAPKSSKVPAWVRAILLRGLQPNPDERYPSMEGLLADLQKDPAIARRRWFNASAAAMLIGIAVLGYRQVKHQQSQLCKGAEKELAGIWNPEKRAAISKAFLATGKPYAQDAVHGVQKALDGYTQSWVAMHTEACEAARLKGNQSEDLLDLRMQCLSQRREELKSLVEIFDNADAKVVEKSVEAAQALTNLDNCANATALKAPVRPPADAATRTKVENLRKRLATAKALDDAGIYAQGIEVATAATAEAKALGYHPVEAEALIRLGLLQGRSGDRKAALQTLDNAVLAADAGHHDEVAANAWISVVVVHRLLGEYEKAHETAKHAFAAIERMGGNDELLDWLHVVLSNVLSNQGKFEEALAEHQRAQAIRERMGPQRPESPHYVASLTSLAWLLGSMGRYEESLQYYHRALVLRERTIGPNHPAFAMTLSQASTVLTFQGDYDEALDYQKRAQVIFERTLGLQNPMVAMNLARMGAALIGLAKHDEALVSLQRSLRIYEQTQGPHHPELTHPLNDTGFVLSRQGKYRAAVDYHERALVILEKTVGPKHPDVASTLGLMADAYQGLGQSGKAIVLRERALSISESHPERPVALAHARFDLARALGTAGHDRLRARMLAVKAREAFSAAGEKQKKALAQVDAWLSGKQ